MVDFRIILRLVEFVLCILYNGVALIVIPDCIEAITYYAKIVTAGAYRCRRTNSKFEIGSSPCFVSVSSDPGHFAKVLDQN